MTELEASEPVCERCGRTFARATTGRPRRWCSHACRQRAYQQRLRTAESTEVEAQLRLARDELEGLRDRLDVLARALDDVETDLAGEPDDTDVRGALAWLREAAHGAVG